MKQWWRGIRPNILSGVAYLLARFIGLTVRLRTVGYEAVKDLPGGRIYAGWHGTSLLPANYFKGQGVWALISLSRDGDMQNAIFRHFGFKTIRGSSGRGGARAAAESVRVLKKGGYMAFTPDGPRGPSGVVKEGVIFMAKRSGAFVVPIGTSASMRWLAPTWDRYIVPFPFSRAVMVFGRPIWLSVDATDEESEAARLRLEQEIHRAQAEADRLMGHGPNAPEPEPARDHEKV